MPKPWEKYAGGAPGTIVAAPQYRVEQDAREESRKDQDQGFDARRVAATETGVALDQQRIGITREQNNREERKDARDQVRTSTNDRAARADKLRSDYEALPSVKTYTAALPVFGAGLRSGADAAGDLNLIYAYAKVMDPNSVVREGEQASVAGGDTWINQKEAQLKKQLGDGGTFQPAFRARLREEMAGRMGELNQLYIADRVRYKDISDRAGIDVRDVVGEHPGGRYQALSEQVLGRKQQQLDYNGLPIATGATKAVDAGNGPQVEALRALLAGGASDDQVRAAATSLGADAGSIDKVLAFRAANPGKGGDFGAGNLQFKEAPTTAVNRFFGSPGGTAVGAFVDASMGGTSDELGALFGGGDLADLNARKQATFAANPKAALAGQVGGSIAAMIGAGKLAGAAPYVSSLSNPALVADLAFGGFSGAGQNNDGRLIGAAGGAAGAMAGNVAGSLIAKPIGALARTEIGTKGVNVARELMGKLPGVDARAPIVGAAAPDAAEQALLTTAERAGIPQITGQLADAQAQNLPFSLADTAPSLAELGGAATRRSPVARNLAETVLTQRGRGQIERMGASVERELGPIGNTLQLSDDLATQARTAASPFYGQAYATPVPSTPEMESLLSTPFGRQGIARARTIIANERGSPTEMGFALDANGDTVLNPQPNQIIAQHLIARSELDAAQDAYRAARSQPGSLDAARARVEQARQAVRDADRALSAAPDPTVPASVPTYTTQALDYTKRGMDDVLEQYRNPVTNRLVLDEGGRAQNQVKNQLLSEVDRLNEPFRQARAAYQGPMEARDALYRGQDFYGSSVGANQVAASVADQTPEHLAQMQLGYRDAMMGQANNLRYSTNPWQTLNSPGAEAKLAAMYPETPGVANLLSQRDAEIQMAATTNRVIGGSPTAPRMIADEQFLPGAGAAAAVDAATAATGGVPLASVARMLASSKVGDALRVGVGRKAEAKAEALAPLLFNLDPATNLSVVQDLLAKSAAYREFVEATTPTRSLSRLGSGYGSNKGASAVR
jgi:hypothetical protein